MVAQPITPIPPVPFTLPVMEPNGPERRKFTRQEYYRLAEMGFFEGQHVELIAGEILSMPPMGKPHAVVVNIGDELLRPLFGEGYTLRVRSPFSLPEDTEPEPDIAVVRGKARDFLKEHPRTAVLIVEVAQSSLEYDREFKSGLYALAGVPDYWILNLNERQLEVRREPGAMNGKPFGMGYRSLRVYTEAEEVSPLEKPEAAIQVAELLP